MVSALMTYCVWWTVEPALLKILEKDFVVFFPYKTEQIKSLVLKLETNEYIINNVMPEFFYWKKYRQKVILKTIPYNVV